MAVSKCLTKSIKKIGRCTLVSCLTALLLLVIIPFLSITLIPLFIHRWIISKCAVCFKSHELSKMVTSGGAMLSMKDVYNEYALTSVLTVEIAEPCLDISLLRNLVMKNAIEATDSKTGSPKYPELTKTLRIWMGYVFLAPVDHFDIKDHVYYLKDSSSITEQWKTKHDVSALLLQLTRYNKWVKGKPLWEFIVIPNVSRELLGSDTSTGPTCTLMHFRIHHAIADGISNAKLLTSIFKDNKFYSKFSKPNLITHRRNCVAQLLHDVYFYLKAPYEFIDLGLTIFHYHSNPPQLGPGKSDYTAAMSPDIPIQLMKDVKNMHNVELNSLIFAMITGGVRHMLLKYWGEANVPKNIPIGFPLPKPNHPDKLRNHLTFGVMLLPVGEVDPVERLQKIYQRILKVKTSTLPWTGSLLYKCAGSLPAPLFRLISPTMPSLFLTNLPGPPDAMKVGESPVIGLRVGTNIPTNGPQGYGFLFTTYDGNARLIAGGLSKCLPTPEDAEELLKHSLEQLEILSHVGTV